MNISFFSTIKDIYPRLYYKMLFLLLKNPKMIIGTIKATLLAIKYSKKYYPKTHNMNGKGNAFKHILWNMLLIHLVVNDKTVAKNWVIKFTTLYEDCFINEKKSTQMDLKNNMLGREMYFECKIKTTQSFINYILQHKVRFYILKNA